MLSKQYDIKIFKKRLVLFLITTMVFIVAFVLNIGMNRPLYNFNLNEVPIWQKDQFWGSHGFLTFMNVISNIFNPLICAGYILLFFLFSYRKLQILVFLVWFIFLSWILSLLKMIFHQARPYWIQQSGIQMLEWTCYTQYGMPSGHSMMAIILMQFIVRFFAKVNKCVSKCIIIFYILIIILQVCVMFSRVILGMHSLNQVLFGCVLGCFSFIPYYLFVQKLILKWVLSIFQSPKSVFTIMLLTCISICALAAEILIALLLNYYNSSYINVINSISGCNGFHIYKSFQYKCLEDSALIMAGVGILTAFNYIKNPTHLSCQLQYSKCSFKFLGRFIITIIIPGIILAIFLNPLWQRITVNNQSMAFIIWACQILGFYFGTLSLICLVPIVTKKLKLQNYKIPQNYQQYRKYQSTQFTAQQGFRLSNLLVKKIRQTQLTQTDKSIQIRLKFNQTAKPI